MTATPAELADYLKRKVSPFLLPSRLEIVAALPLTAEGRVDRSALAAKAGRPPRRPPPAIGGRALAGAGRRRGAAAPGHAVACRLFDVSHIEPHVNMMDIGATSYQLVRLATVLEEELGSPSPSRRCCASRRSRSSWVATSRQPARPWFSIVHCGAVALHCGATVTKAELARTTEPASCIGGAASAPAADRPTSPMGCCRPAAAAGVQGRPPWYPARPRRQSRRSHGRAAESGVGVGGGRRSVRTFDRPAGTLGGSSGPDINDPERHAPAANRRSGTRRPAALYPVQLYVLVAPGRVRDLPGGSYYYHPVAQHACYRLDPHGTLPASAHGDINRAAFRESAFSLFLIGRMTAISPLYGELSWDFTVFEAGAMTQLLGPVAAEAGWGCARWVRSTSRRCRTVRPGRGRPVPAHAGRRRARGEA